MIEGLICRFIITNMLLQTLLKIKVLAVAMAAPRMPKRGMAIAFSPKLVVTVNSEI